MSVDLKTMTRQGIIDWMREKGYDGPVSYTKADLIAKIVPDWLGEGGVATELAEGTVTDISEAKAKPKRSRAKKAQPAAEESPVPEPEAEAEPETAEVPEGEAPAAADA